MRRMLALWLPNWPVQRLIAEHPELAAREVVLYEEQRYGNRVTACSSAATALGIRPGMPLAEAKVLITGCEAGKWSMARPPGGSAQASSRELTFLVHDRQRDQAELQRLASWCERFSPLVGLKPGQSDTLLMDVTGVSGLHGGEAALLQNVVTEVQQRGLTVFAAIADTATAAWATARWGIATPADISPSTPRWKIIPPGDTAEVDKLPVAAMCLDPRTHQQLQRLGIERLGQLFSLPRSSLSTRFGKRLLERLDQIRGRSEEVIAVPPRQSPLEAAWSFEYPTAHRKTILLVMERLLDGLSKQLRAQSRGVLQLECRLVPADRRPPRLLNIGLYQPTTEPQHLRGLVQMQFESLRISHPVAEIQVIATSTAVLEQRQRNLFLDDSRENPQKLALLIERLSGRLGRDKVVGAQLLPDAQPELAWRAIPLTGDRPAEPSPAASQAAAPALPSIRPLRLLSPPEPIGVVGLVSDGPPAMFHYRGTSYRVARYFGPERIETGWWRGESCRRDYYRVETASGLRLWLFRKLQDQGWFVHGEFD